MPVDRMKLLEWLREREAIHPGVSLNGMTMLQETSGLAGVDGLPWEAVARAAADLLKLELIDWRYVRPFNEVGETPPHLMDQRYVQRVEDIMVTAHNLTSGETNLTVPDALILFMFMFSFILALSASAIASPSISSEVESGVLMTVVTPPVRRTEVLLGKWLGLATLLAGYAAGVCALEFGVIRLVSGF